MRGQSYSNVFANLHKMGTSYKKTIYQSKRREHNIWTVLKKKKLYFKILHKESPGWGGFSSGLYQTFKKENIENLPQSSK